MRNLSVTTFIHILFSLAIIILIATFLLFLSWDKDRQKIEEFKRYQLISITFLSNLQLKPKDKELQKLHKELQVNPLSSKQSKAIKTQIEKVGKTVFSGGSSVGQMRVFEIEDIRYIYVQRMGYNLMLKDNKKQNYNFEYAMGIGLFLIALLLLLYLAVLKKLSPLKKLHKEIQQFAKGDMQTRISYLYDDEIGKIAKSFDDAIVHINELSTSKNLFMRNLMHELKTPITKGRIVVEMMEDEETKKVLVRAFERMNELISELAELERVTTQSFEPNFEYILLKELIEDSRELLMAQNPCIEIYIEEIGLVTDKKLMVLVLKNLMDNGMKYGKDKCVTIKNKHNIIEIISEGEALEHALSYYTEPFSQAEKRSTGFGLGLYIVHSILDKLGYNLGYKHKSGKNIFMLIPEKN
ncbi:MAG: sensor histidine kinase [Epsilonproteobacteria bacterium]|nr:MAG: sensor histidine kinase [Campylobacterota bacterium]